MIEGELGLERLCAVSCADVWGETSCREKRGFVSFALSHSFSSVSANAITKKRNRTGAMLSPCLTPTVNGIEVSILPIISRTFVFAYMRFIADTNFGGPP